MIHTFKKLFSFIITLLMVISLGTASKVTVFADDAVAKVGDTTYSTLVDAVKAAEDGETITLLKDFSGGGIGTYSLPSTNAQIKTKNFTIDFGGHTYTCSAPAVGSKGFETQGFHLEKGVKVTLENGTIKTAAGTGVKMLVQNYCNLTLQDITLDGSDLNQTSYYYTLSNCCGTINILGNTNIIAHTGGFAFDVNYKNGYKDAGLSVTVNTTGTITGNIEFDADTEALAVYAQTNKIPFSLNIENGNFNGALSVYNVNNNPDITISGGNFTFDPSKYVKTGFTSENGVFPSDGISYSYRVSEVKPVENKIESVTAKAYADKTEDTSNQVTASLTDTTIKVVGKVPTADTKVTITYTTTDNNSDTKDINYVNDAFVNPGNVTVGNTTYTFDITELSKMPAEVAVVPAAPKAAVDETITDESKRADASAVAETIQKNVASTGNEGLASAVTNEVKDDAGTTAGVATDAGTVTAQSETTTAALKKEKLTVDEETQKVVVVAQPYIDIKVADIAKDEKTSAVTEITLEIEPKYNVVAVVVKQNATSVGTIDTTGSSGTKNAAVVAKEQTMKVTTPVVLSIPLPSTFKIDKDNFYVKHVHKNDDGSTTTNYYKATVTGTDPQIATFTTDGFSTYTFTNDSRVATINFDDGTTGNYNLTSVTAAFPVSTKEGYTFKGWKIYDSTQTYFASATAMSDDMLETLKGKNVNATAVFEYIPVDQTAPAAPELESTTSNSITLKKIAAHDTAAAQYRINGGAWQDSNVFTGLSADTVYKFEARYAAVDGKYNASAASKTASFATKAEETEEADTYDVYRLYNPNSGEHFYTTSTEERDIIVEAGWNYEGVGWTSPSTSSTPIYRLYNSVGGEHHYTTSDEERDFLVDNGWNYEGITCYSDDAHTVAIYRQYNPNQFACNHNFTRTEEERDWLVDLGWKDEGTAWYAVN
jgi:hypothetical protein